MTQLLDIATAKTRNQGIWRNEQISWESLVKRLSATRYTHESYADYVSAPKPRQDEIKDVGGFVGGYLIDGHRGKGFVKWRQIVTLDIDFGYSELWDDFIMYFPDVAAAVYSTHKHSVLSPRLRLVLPLDRPVDVEQYEAISRKIASVIGMQYFDRTTFQPYRLMYWPSTAKDGHYYFKEQKGVWLSADKVLEEYRDWKNVSEWPLCPTETDIIKTDLRRQEDPLTKEGLVGAFCRSYSISEAIEEFLPETYTHCEGDRYTYTQGTTAGGAIAYEDKFLYSHHATDPIGGLLCNAFDLVRIHKYGHEDLDKTLSPGKQPSFGKMVNLARTDPKVIHELGVFNLDPSVTEGENTEWLSKLETNKRGEYLSTIDNFKIILQNDPVLKGKFLLNEFDHRIYIKGSVPWDEGNKLREIQDADESGGRHRLESTYNIYHTAKYKDAFDIVSRENSFHPVKEYLLGLKWDGTPRLDTLFIDHLGVPDTTYARHATRKALTAAVARIMRPGIKFDYMIVTVGQQGKGKSSLFYDLGKEWFSDTLDSVTGKEAYIQLQGVWLLEMAELSGIKKAELEAVKNFITKREDRFRPPYGKHTVSYKRQVVPFGSTNDWSFLKDPTGNRRFWPLVVTKKYTPGTIDADPIWAEAVWRYKEGEALYLSEEVEKEAEQHQLLHTEADERAALISTYLDMPLPTNWDTMSRYERRAFIGAGEKGTVQRTKVCIPEIWVEMLGHDIKEMSSYSTKYVHNIMASMGGWKRGGIMHFGMYGSQRGYVRENVTDVFETKIEKSENV